MKNLGPWLLACVVVISLTTLVLCGHAEIAMNVVYCVLGLVFVVVLLAAL